MWSKKRMSLLFLVGSLLVTPNLGAEVITRAVFGVAANDDILKKFDTAVVQTGPFVNSACRKKEGVTNDDEHDTLKRRTALRGQGFRFYRCLTVSDTGATYQAFADAAQNVTQPGNANAIRMVMELYKFNSTGGNNACTDTCCSRTGTCGRYNAPSCIAC